MFKIFKPYPELFIAFSEKKDGSMKLPDPPIEDSAASKRRRTFLKKANISPAKLVSAEIVHGNKIETVTTLNAGTTAEGADGLITRETGLYLSVTSADCLPVFLFEPKAKVACTVHAGWRGLEKNILANAVNEMEALGADPKLLLAGIGPSICSKHYEVHKEVAEKFASYIGATKKTGEVIFLDLKKIARIQLLNLGIRENKVESRTCCTFESPDKYFSARRDKLPEIQAMMAIIGMIK